MCRYRNGSLTYGEVAERYTFAAANGEARWAAGRQPGKGLIIRRKTDSFRLRATHCSLRGGANLEARGGVGG